MRKLHFHYAMRISYTQSATMCRFTIKCMPQDTLRQRISKLKIRLDPAVPYMEGEDSFGNRKIYGCVDEPHDYFVYEVEGEAETGACHYEESARTGNVGIYKYPFGCNRPGEKLRAYSAELPVLDEYLDRPINLQRMAGTVAGRNLSAAEEGAETQSKDVTGKYTSQGDNFSSLNVADSSWSLETRDNIQQNISEMSLSTGDMPRSYMNTRGEFGSKLIGGIVQQRMQPGMRKYSTQLELATYNLCVDLMHHLHEDFRYQSGCTSMDTTAEEAWAFGCGVCQDYAHIYIALLHMRGIPARYVTGMIPGEGASHAWVEVCCDGNWYGFDPTNDTVVSNSHIRIGTGRDASDCLINRGIMRGGGQQTQEVRVRVDFLN